MCNASIQLMNVCESEVLLQMQAKASFTAIDISNALKTAKYPVRHREVAEVVRDIYNSGAMTHFDYDRQLINVVIENGAKTAQTYLYHPRTVSPSIYQKLDQEALPPVPTDQARDLSDCVAADPLGLFKRSPSSATTHNRRLQTPHSHLRSSQGRRDGALPIPSRIIAQLGWTDGETLTLRFENDNLIIESVLTAHPPLDATKVRVWSGRRVRICKTKLQLGALAADQTTVSVNGSSLCLAALPHTS